MARYPAAPGWVREIETGDAAAIARVIGAPNVLRYTTWKGPADAEEATNFVSMAKDTAVAIPRDEYLLATVDIESGEVAGAGDLRIVSRVKSSPLRIVSGHWVHREPASHGEPRPDDAARRIAVQGRTLRP